MQKLQSTEGIEIKKIFRKRQKKIDICKEVSGVIKKYFSEDYQLGQWQLFLRGKLTEQLLKHKRTLRFE